MQQRLNALSVERVENVLLPYVQQVNKLVLYAFPKKKYSVYLRIKSYHSALR
jgi:hypothetical protein